MIKGKKGFWLLTIIFSVLILVAVLSPLGPGEIAPEHGGTMGSMMKKQHAQNISLVDLFSQSAGEHQASMGGHNHPVSLLMKTFSLFSTSLILFLLPVIIGATLVMIVLWI